MKAFCVDLDGTLLNSRSIISENNKQAIRMAINKGNKVFIVSGRPYCFSKLIAKEIHEDIEVIAYNGGCYDRGEEIIIKPIGNDRIISIINILENTSCKSFFKGKNLFYTADNYDERFLYDHINDRVSDDLKVKSYTNLSWKEIRDNARDIIKILVYSSNKEEIIKLNKQIRKVKGLTVSVYMDKSLDITSNYADKGLALKEVINYYNIDKSKVIAIGDSENDIPMMMQAGYRVAMGNADRKIKDMCDFITISNDEDGVSFFINRLLESKIIYENIKNI